MEEEDHKPRSVSSLWSLVKARKWTFPGGSRERVPADINDLIQWDLCWASKSQNCKTVTVILNHKFKFIPYSCSRNLMYSQSCHTCSPRRKKPHWHLHSWLSWLLSQFPHTHPSLFQGNSMNRGTFQYRPWNTEIFSFPTKSLDFARAGNPVHRPNLADCLFLKIKFCWTHSFTYCL